MAFDGSYFRWVREEGVIHRIHVRRARCPGCGVGHALLPDFVVGRRRDSSCAIGAAILAHAGQPVPAGASRLYERVPERTVRSWRQRFAERADELARQFAALCVAWGDQPPKYEPAPVKAAIQMIGATWRAASRRRGHTVPPAWPLANVILGSQMLGTRVDVPHSTAPELRGRSRAP